MTSSNPEKAIQRLGYLLVAGVLFLHWGGLAEFQIDIPKTDDWRKLISGPSLLPGSLEISWLFRPSNSTVYATGKFLDYLFFHFGSGNHAVYQQISLVTVLGACLFFTMRLLERLELPLQWHLLGILSTVYFVQGRAYWGGKPALAYHQALPIVGLLAVLYIVSNHRWGVARAATLAAIVVASGFAYISGAVAMTALGVTLVTIAAGFRLASVNDANFADLGAKSLVVLSAGILTFATQLAIVMGPDSAMPGPPLATPLDWRFWTFWVAQAPRLLGDNGFAPGAISRAVLVNILLFSVVITALARASQRIRAGSHGSRDLHYLVLAGGILVPVLAYLAVVSAGRGHFQMHESVVGLTRMAKSRFHYWWLAPLLTVAAVAPSFFWSSHGKHQEKPIAKRLPTRWLLPVLIVIIAAWYPTKNPWDFGTFYQSVHRKHRAGLRCLERGLANHGPIRCEDLTTRIYNLDLRGPVENARRLGLPFAIDLVPGSEDDGIAPEVDR